MASGPLADFLSARYFGPKTPTPGADIGWRRVDGAWLDNAEQFALAPNSATNNTSLALAIELVDTGQVLLFPADAQVGSWLSWQSLTWPVQGRAVTVEDLLGRVAFYKVGHHGSHNATLKGQGVELMPEQGIVVFIPVDHAMAVKKRWNQMPQADLVAALSNRAGSQLVRIDAELLPQAAGITAGGTGGPYLTNPLILI